jgi:hypothetical protein
MARFYNLFPVAVYTREVPINFETPSMYFPAPFSFDGNDTTQTFLKTYNLSVKLFHKDSQQANNEAESIADRIRSSRSVIPIVDENGSETGDFIRFNKIETRIGDKGVANIILDWDSRYHYERPPWNAAKYFDFKSGVKE